MPVGKPNHRERSHTESPHPSQACRDREQQCSHGYHALGNEVDSSRKPMNSKITTPQRNRKLPSAHKKSSDSAGDMGNQYQASRQRQPNLHRVVFWVIANGVLRNGEDRDNVDETSAQVFYASLQRGSAGCNSNNK